MGVSRRWTGSAFRSGATIRRWNGSQFKTGATPRRWTGSGWQPPVEAVSPSFGFINAVSRYATAANPSFVVPSGVLPGDIVLIGISSANNAATIALAGATVVTGPTDTGSMQGLILQHAGYTAGDTLTLTTNSSVNPSAIFAAWYRGVSSTGGLATAVKSGTVQNLAAPDVTDDTSGDLIVSMYLEKSGANTNLAAPDVAGVTRRAWVPWASNGAGLPSAWLGDYSGPASVKTLTYPVASANGLAAQLRLRAA